MENGADEQTNDDEEQHVRDALAAEDFAEEMRRENEQTDDGDSQTDLSRRTAIGDLFCNSIHQTWVGNSFRNLCDGVVDSR